MTDRPEARVDTELQAYVDGELDSARRDAVADRLQRDRDAGRRVRDYQRLNEMLHAAYDPVLNEQWPAELVTARRRRGANLLPWATAAAWLLVGGAVGWMLRGGQEPAGMRDVNVARQAIDAHVVYSPEVRHAVEVGAAEKAHLNKWLSKRLKHAVVSPDLRSEGFQLVGGRLLPDAGRPAAQYMYEDSEGERLTLYIRANPAPVGQSAFRYAEHESATAIFWIEAELAYALVGRMERDRLERVAEVAYRQLGD